MKLSTDTTAFAASRFSGRLERYYDPAETSC
jgi:hypothetical protein